MCPVLLGSDPTGRTFSYTHTRVVGDTTPGSTTMTVFFPPRFVVPPSSPLFRRSCTSVLLTVSHPIRHHGNRSQIYERKSRWRYIMYDTPDPCHRKGKTGAKEVVILLLRLWWTGQKELQRLVVHGNCTVLRSHLSPPP